MWQEIEPEAFAKMLSNGELEPTQIIDVRERFEWDYYHLNDTTWLAMNEIPSRIGELRTDKPLFIVCAHGVRSAAVCRFLHEKGYEGLRNVTGGMAAVAELNGFAYD